MPGYYDGRRVLVTGGAGFIGAHLVEQLVEQGSHVAVVDNLSSGNVANLSSVAGAVALRKVDLAHDDLAPVLAEGDFELIFHLAGMANPVASVDDPRKDLERNLLSTFNLLDALRHALPGARLLNTSSALVYGNAPDPPWLEETPTHPVSPYGVSKLAAETYVGMFAQLYGLRTVTVRLFGVFGPRLRKQVIYDLMRKLEVNTDELSLQGTGAECRDVTYVSNVVDAMMLVAEKAPALGEVYNVGTGEAVSIRRLAELICEEMDVNPRLVFAGNPRPGDVTTFAGDVSRLEALGYRTRVELSDGLRRTVAWFREEAVERGCDAAVPKT